MRTIQEELRKKCKSIMERRVCNESMEEWPPKDADYYNSFLESDDIPESVKNAIRYSDGLGW